MKTCTKCKSEKESTDFFKDKRGVDGLYANCKECHYAYYGGSRHRVNLRKLQTPQNAAKQLHAQILTRVGVHPYYKNIELQFSVEELIKYLTKNWNQIKLMYDKWVESDFSRRYIPTVDRLDSSDHYRFENIQILPFCQNVSRAHKGVSRLKTDEHKENIAKSMFKYHAERINGKTNPTVNK